MSGKVGLHLVVGILGYTDLMLGDQLKQGILLKFFEFALGSLAEGAYFGCLVTFVNVTADGADKFLLHSD